MIDVGIGVPLVTVLDQGDAPARRRSLLRFPNRLECQIRQSARQLRALRVGSTISTRGKGWLSMQTESARCLHDDRYRRYEDRKSGGAELGAGF